MSEKANLTQAQERALKNAWQEKGKSNLINKHSTTCYDNDWEPLNDLSTNDVARALYIGYEVEPEFKVGDWVITGRGVLGKYQGEHNGVYKFELVGGHHACSDNLRHATPEEVTQEKEQRTDKKLDKLLLDLNSEERIRLYRKLDCRLDIEVE